MNIVVRSPNWIGDCLMSVPAIRALTDNCPRDDIYLVTKNYLADIYTNLTGIKDIITIPDISNLKNTLKYAAKLRKCHFNNGILFTNSFHSAFFFKLAGVKNITGYNKDLRGFLLNHKMTFPYNSKKQHADFYTDLVECFLKEEKRKSVNKKYSDQILITSEKKEEIQRILKDQCGLDFSGLIIGISPVAAYGTAKQWLPERFSQLIKKIQKNWQNSEILFFGSNKEREKISKIINSLNRTHNLAGKLSLGESISAISLCHMFVSNDSGLMHTAASLRVPLVAIFGPTLPSNTGPTNKQGIILHHPVECAPCTHRNCPIDHKCMTAIGVEEVWQAMQGICKEGSWP